jgi:hypothetical protein
MHAPAHVVAALDSATVETTFHLVLAALMARRGKRRADEAMPTAISPDWREEEMDQPHTSVRLIAALMALLMVATSAPVTRAASHREAPLIALDPTADITDVYAFRSWEDPTKAVFIMNVIPSQVPASGPNFFNFDDDVLYAFHFDLNADGKADDLTIKFRFTTEIRSPFDDLPVAYAGVDSVPGLPPAITALDGSGSAGLGLRQRYSVQAIDGNGQEGFNLSTDSAGRPLIVVPSNVGSRTMPNYPALAAQGIFDLGSGIRVFAGQRKETFYIDLGSAFDTLNFRRNPPVLSDAEDADDRTNPFGLNDFQALNINTIAIEIPIAFLPPVLGMYASTSRQRVEVRKKDGTSGTAGPFVQVARLANPLVNELIIGTGYKDRWNATDPAAESQFLDFYQSPRLAAVLNLAFGIPVPPTPRSDLLAVLLKYPVQSPDACTHDNLCSELLRLDLTVPPTSAADQKRLTVLAHDAAGNPTPDPAGWPNGRRPNDDVTDIAIRVVAGVLVAGPTAGFPHNRLGDGVNFSEVLMGTPDVTSNGIATTFPFLPTPIAGRR